MNRIKGILYAAVSSSTFGLAPFFSITLLLAGFSAFEVLSYRWGVAAIVLTLFGWCSGCNFRLAKKDLLVVFLLSLLRATTSFSLLIAYQNIATGVASTIHFMYPLAVSLAMMFFFHEKKSLLVTLRLASLPTPLNLLRKRLWLLMLRSSLNCQRKTPRLSATVLLLSSVKSSVLTRLWELNESQS